MIQHAFNMLANIFALSIMLNDLFKRPQHLVHQSVERMLKQMLKPFKRFNDWIAEQVFNRIEIETKLTFLHSLDRALAL